MRTSKTGLIGWLTIAGGAIVIVNLVFVVLFFSIGEPYGMLNDITSIFQVMLIVPVLLFFLTVLRVHNRMLVTLATAIGVVGVVVTGVVQALLVLRVIPYDQTVAPNMIGGGLIGVWLILANWLARQNGLEKGALPWFGIAAGIGYIVLVIGFSLGGQNHPLFQVGGGITALSYPIWAIWLGSLMINGKVATVR